MLLNMGQDIVAIARCLCSKYEITMVTDLDLLTIRTIFIHTLIIQSVFYSAGFIQFT